MRQPAVGRIVHYVSYGTPGGEYASQCRAAIITEVPQPEGDFNHERIGIAVLNPTGLFFDRGVEHDEDTRAGGTWHWPEYVTGYDGGPTRASVANAMDAMIPRPDRTPGPDVP